MSIRDPAVAGQFYPASPAACRAEVEAYLQTPEEVPADPEVKLVGGIVPHAGWICSGVVAGQVIAAFQDEPIDTFVVFGAVHRVTGRQVSVYPEGTWRTPLGQMAIDEELASAVLNADTLLVDDPRSHVLEHSIEVQIPFLQVVQPSARLLPIGVPSRFVGPDALRPALRLHARRRGPPGLGMGQGQRPPDHRALPEAGG